MVALVPKPVGTLIVNKMGKYARAAWKTKAVSTDIQTLAARTRLGSVGTDSIDHSGSCFIVFINNITATKTKIKTTRLTGFFFFLQLLRTRRLLTPTRPVLSLSSFYLQIPRPQLPCCF